MTGAEILKRIERLGALGTLPVVAEKINEAVARESCTPGMLAGIIEKDASLAARVLKLANSSFYGLSRQVDTIPRAITVLGFNMVRDTALTVSVHRLFTGRPCDGLDIEGLWRHSLACAVAARAVVGSPYGEEAQQAFLGGVLHDIGVLLMGRLFPEETRTLCQARQRTTELLAAERAAVGVTHPEVGAIACEHWNFPAPLVELIRWHHQPQNARRSSRCAAAVHAGNEIVKAMRLGTAVGFFVGDVGPDVWNLLGITAADLPLLVGRIGRDFENAQELFKGQGAEEKC